MFGAMGSTVHVVVVGGPEDAHDRAASRVAELERLWSRFLDDSEMNRLNRGEECTPSPSTVRLIQCCLRGWEMTDGLFDPTVLEAMVAAGYDRSRTVGPGTVTAANHPSPGLAGVDPTHPKLPDGVRIDPGGIGKGLAADLVTDELMKAGAAGALVNVGGDLRVAGRAPGARGWDVAIEDPFDEERNIVTIHIADGAVATTTPSHRRWTTPDGRSTHIIDPRTGSPAVTDVASATVLAGEAWIAEAVAKAAALSGADRAIAYIEDRGLAGAVVSTEGRMLLSANIGAFL